MTANYTKPGVKTRPAEPDDRALGRSRGGLTTKIHAIVDHLLRPVELILTGGQAGDNPQLVPLLDGYRITRAAAGLASRRIHLLADKAYSHPSTRKALRRRRIRCTIPERDNQVQYRRRRGSRGGRPPTFSADRYKDRNTIERGFGRLKQWRGIATRYDKYATTYLGGLTLAAVLQHRH